LMVFVGLAEDAAAGRPWVVWVEGEPGSGKTVLARRALAALPAGFTVFRAEADEFHWADIGSRQALLAAVRRLDKDRLVVIVTSRPGFDEPWDRFRMDTDRCRQVLLADFNVEEVATLAAVVGVELTHRQAERLQVHTRGHPLWVRTLLAELSPAQLRAADGDLPAPRSLASSVTARLSELPSDARDLAAAMAVINQRSPLPTVGRVAGLAEPVGPFELLLNAGFARWDPTQPGPPVEFAHPLYRQAVYEDLSPTRRRDLHRVVAEVLTPATVLAHRVAAADGVDDGLADDLEAAARRELDAGTAALGARDLLWASSLSGTSQQAERRLLEAVRALLDDAQTTQAAGMRNQLRRRAASYWAWWTGNWATRPAPNAGYGRRPVTRQQLKTGVAPAGPGPNSLRSVPRRAEPRTPSTRLIRPWR
jgi:hypothetical protein